MSIRKRTWGNQREAWVVDFTYYDWRRLKTFRTKDAAERFETVARAVASGIAPEPLARGHRPIEFTADLPTIGWRSRSGGDAVAEAFKAEFPNHAPSTDAVVLHVLAEMSPSSSVCDVDNLLKPVLDALNGIAWVDDTQVCECLIRRSHGRGRKLTIRIWQIPQPSVRAYQRAIETGLGGGRKGPWQG